MDPTRKRALDALLAGSPYVVIDDLGRGAMADVFVARHKFLRKKFALKLIRPHLSADVAYVERLKREARSLGKIESPHVVRIVDLASATNGAPYLVLELMKGHSLARELQARRRLPTREALQWSTHALLGLRAAHNLGLVHRDITPENLFLTEAVGSPRTLKIMDFGLTRALPDAGELTRNAPGGMTTSTGAIVGSPAYASPEAFRGERLDERADIYGVGLVLFEMLTGLDPFDLDGTLVPAPSTKTRGISPDLDRLVLSAVHPDREARVQTAADFLQALRELPGEPSP